eukprot:TRINITY_DN16528_c0_g1_i4.p1 TRINITY_DN16528_c0_g1~~TRINITY_DN16528_c0_g1_i4.p1  ORF type:complete len:123 (+),score=11.48 TRINITY_DN16528_c0_g1_i4:378-746(+)
MGQQRVCKAEVSLLQESNTHYAIVRCECLSRKLASGVSKNVIEKLKEYNKTYCEKKLLSLGEVFSINGILKVKLILMIAALILHFVCSLEEASDLLFGMTAILDDILLISAAISVTCSITSK